MNSREILTFLKTPLDTTHGEIFHKLIQEIKTLEGKLNHCERPNWSTLARARLFASTTNTKVVTDSLYKWDAANQYISREIQNDSNLDINLVSKINAILIGDEDNIRSGPIYCNDISYIDASFIEDATQDFSNLILRGNFSCTFEKAFHIYLWLTTLHIFKDGNGRTGRLAADFILMKEGKLPICFESTVDAQVAQLQEKKVRSKEESYLKFLKAVRRSYLILTSP
ncbi:Fic family protein [Bacteriovorax sp. Seq25_V]|uniref:Fic family protein n=1 Tax=Bacteriovorax sp. Seq25_V TaxID=1201288 RepID=UPI00038A0807|nr:Fic family protein [Bacteriovorax sp. Seq25_V]EQC45359.1 Fic/DOC family protein [Bacteriovorax sp. Seq25_V]